MKVFSLELSDEKAEEKVREYVEMHRTIVSDCFAAPPKFIRCA